MASDLNSPIANLDSVDYTDMPPWALVLIQSMKGLFRILVMTSFNDLAKNVAVLESEKVVNVNVTKLLEAENVRLNERIIGLTSRLDDSEARIDDNEQRNRNQCLLFHGIDERDGETTDE